VLVPTLWARAWAAEGSAQGEIGSTNLRVNR